MIQNIFSKTIKCNLLLLFCLLIFAVGCTTQDNDTSQIRLLINNTFDKPNSKVMIDPIVIVDTFAIADWEQDEKAGRALLKKEFDTWKLWSCGGKDFKEKASLVLMGVPNDVAAMLSYELFESEEKLNPQ